MTVQTALPGTLPESRSATTGQNGWSSAGEDSVHHRVTTTGEVAFIAPPRSIAYSATKRVIDLTLGVLGLAATLVIGLVVAPWIKIKSPGPVLFRQERLGEHGKPFTCLKFRTMDLDAEARKQDLAHLNEAQGPVFKITHDPRHIPSLRWLRKFSIDEMPQFWNVVRGDMSLVGPRPPIPGEVASYSPRQLGRLTVKPGMTCTWQVNGRSDVDFEQWVEMDLDYIERRSTLLDLTLIVKTIPAVLSGRGAS
ncbi:MAG: sugar transferase [Thermomicrobiales bacterium]|nr:sugar transferase [Thermomicrobiales bacterium]